MQTYYETFQGIVLFIKKYRERDLLIKLMTDRFGKRMFFVKGGQRANHLLKQSSFPFVRAEYIGHINKEGLSFINETERSYFPKRSQIDIEANAYLTYIAGLVDASAEDGTVDAPLFHLLWQAIEKIETGCLPAIITNIVEIQLLPKFGVLPELRQCVVCAKTTGVFDYSFAYSGLLCREHFHLDDRRLHWTPRAAYFIQLFSQTDMDRVKTTTMKAQTIQEIRVAIDQLYDEYVGIRLKSKRFIEQMNKMINSLDDKKQNQV